MSGLAVNCPVLSGIVLAIGVEGAAGLDELGGDGLGDFGQVGDVGMLAAAVVLVVDQGRFDDEDLGHCWAPGGGDPPGGGRAGGCLD
jgi:hypothetical protein